MTTQARNDDDARDDDEVARYCDLSFEAQKVLREARRDLDAYMTAYAGDHTEVQAKAVGHPSNPNPRLVLIANGDDFLMFGVSDVPEGWRHGSIGRNQDGTLEIWLRPDGAFEGVQTSKLRD